MGVESRSSGEKKKIGDLLSSLDIFEFEPKKRGFSIPTPLRVFFASGILSSHVRTPALSTVHTRLLTHRTSISHAMHITNHS